MKIYLSACKVIDDLHQRGFTDDFEVKEDALLWVQNRIVLDPDQFSIIECHRFLDAGGNRLIISGVISVCYEAKGILINRYSILRNKFPSVIEKKIKKLLANTCRDESQYSSLIFIDYKDQK
ncbi:hypothetical protein QWZ08_10690 [Ferruginibacter paludis]|uniref:hypothetical protein n=1 Tax=Ferruginibacter paludis TaxID=1310417 RepID=UPI0025B327EE|nr:hypothetical protein [Ferruginibacter paludis]MDN3656095.1 hypothetical protein [Ferruginibacter paludis]